MSEPPVLPNAFSPGYLTLLREKDEPKGPWSGGGYGPLEIRETEGGFGLFRSWRSPDTGDVPEAEFASLEDARLAVAARSALRRTRFYQIQDAQGSPPREGYAVENEGTVVGRIRSYDPEWMFACHVLTCIAQSPEHLAALLDLAGPATQEDVGEILGRTTIAAGAGPGAR